MLEIEEVLELSVPPSDEKSTWFAEAVTAIEYVVHNSHTDEVLLYANVGLAKIHSVLLPLASVTPPDPQALKCANFANRWRIEHVSGGGEPDRMFLSSPCDGLGIKGSKAGQQLVFRRNFTEVDEDGMRTEISQPMIQALEIYWLDEESAYCRLDNNGDIQPVIKLYCLEEKTSKPGAVLITILAEELHRYMAVTDCALVTKFDFTRVAIGRFTRWQLTERESVEKVDLFYDVCVQSGASFVRGVLITRPRVKKELLIAQENDKWTEKDKKFVTFIAYDFKNDQVVETSCSPTDLSSYFDKGSSLPFETTPAFFSGEVLQRYKADPEKFQIENRIIHSRAGWFLKFYDVNEAGQVFSYLCDLARLPYKEQLIWKGFNEKPKGPISARAFQSDFHGKIDPNPDPLDQLKIVVQELDRLQPGWWRIRGNVASNSLHYPTSTSPEEWSNAILALDQFVVEGFVAKSLKNKIEQRGGSYEKEWKTIRLLQEVLSRSNTENTDAIGLIEPLKKTHFLRNKVKGHLAASEKNKIIKSLRKEHGSLAAHFKNLVEDVFRVLDRIVELL